MTPERTRPSRGGPRGRGGGRWGGGGRSGGGSRGPRAPIEPLHPSDQPPDITSFHEWDLGPDVLGVLDQMGISTPTPIQRLAIQAVLDGKDVIAKAETGTGKTLAFGAPMMAKIDAARSTVLGLVLCPTRELAQQVASVLEKLGEPNQIRVALIVGGEPMHPQIDALKAGAQVVVGTPGRVLDLYGQGFLSFPWTEFVVLDEADEMLEIGFIDDVKKILSFTPDERQTLHFSATFPHDVLALSRESTREPVEIATAAGVSTVDTIEQSFLEVSDFDRPRVLRRLLEDSGEDDVFLIFCDRRTEVDQLFRTMERSRIPVKALHGGYDQASRFRVMSAFRDGDVKALLATDVASRGLDVDHVTWVVNYSVPKDVESYTHRIGRTGRAGRKGRALTLVTADKARRWNDITRNAPWEIPEADLRSGSRGGARERERDGGSHGRRGGRSGRGEHGDRDERPAREGGRDSGRRRGRRSREDEPRGREREQPAASGAGTDGPRREPSDEALRGPRPERGEDDGPRRDRGGRSRGRRRSEDEGGDAALRDDRPRDDRPGREERGGDDRPRRRGPRPDGDRPAPDDQRPPGREGSRRRGPSSESEGGDRPRRSREEREPAREPERPRRSSRGDSGERSGERAAGRDREPPRSPRGRTGPDPGGFGAGL